MEAWQVRGRNGNTTDSNTGDITGFHGDGPTNSRYRERYHGERLLGEAEAQHGDRHRRRHSREDEMSEVANSNGCHSESRSSFMSGSNLSSESDYPEDRRGSNASDTDVFLPVTTATLPDAASEQRQILEQKRREIPISQRSWKRVADYVNNLPIIPEPNPSQGGDGAGGGGGKGEVTAQAKRQRIWSEGHERKRVFADSGGSLSFAEGMGPQRNLTTSSWNSSNFSQLSSLSSRDGSQAWFDSRDETDRRMVPQDPPPPPQQPPPQPPPQPQPQPLHGRQRATSTPVAMKPPSKPRALHRQTSAHGGSSSLSEASFRDDRLSLATSEDSHAPKDGLLSPNKDKPLARRMTNSDLIALASQYQRQNNQDPRHQSLRQNLRQNLHQMGTSNLSDSSDTDASHHSYSSIDDLLIARHDPEELLLSLGFGGSTEKDVLDRIPSRFLQQPSRAHGISANQFLNHMDEVERGCGFSLVGGLRSLASALRRSSMMSPTSPSNGSETTRTPAKAVLPNENLTQRPQKVVGEVRVQQREEVKGHQIEQINIHSCQQVRHQPLEQVKVSPSEHVRVQPHRQIRVQTSQQQVTLQPREQVKVHSSINDNSSSHDLSSARSTSRLLTAEVQPKDGSLTVNQPSGVDTHLPKPLTPVAEEEEAVHPAGRHRAENLRTSGPEEANHTSRVRTQGGSRNVTITIQSDGDSLGSRQDGRGKGREKPAELETTNGRGPTIRPRPLQISVHSKVATGGRMAPQVREDSFEFEELSSEERLEDLGGTAQIAELPANNRGNLSRSGSTQSDSSGFADEGIGSGDLESPNGTLAVDDDSTTAITLDSKITQTSFDGEALELPSGLPGVMVRDAEAIKRAERAGVVMTSIESFDLPSVTSLEDSPFDDNVVASDASGAKSQRPRALTFPAALDRTTDGAEPTSPSRLLSSASADSTASGGNAKRKHPKLLKMKSVDPDCYSFKSKAEGKGIWATPEARFGKDDASSRKIFDKITEDSVDAETGTIGTQTRQDGHRWSRHQKSELVQSEQHSTLETGQEALDQVTGSSDQVTKHDHHVTGDSDHLIAEGPDLGGAHLESKLVCATHSPVVEATIIPTSASRQANERLSITPSPSHNPTPSTINKTTDSAQQNQQTPTAQEQDAALPYSKDSVTFLLEDKLNSGFASILSSCTVADGAMSGKQTGESGSRDAEGAVGFRTERILSDICEVSSQSSSAYTDDPCSSSTVCAVPFRAYSSLEFDVEDSDLTRDQDCLTESDHGGELSHECDDRTCARTGDDVESSSPSCELEAPIVATAVSCDHSQPITTRISTSGREDLTPAELNGVHESSIASSSASHDHCQPIRTQVSSPDRCPPSDRDLGEPVTLGNSSGTFPVDTSTPAPTNQQFHQESSLVSEDTAAADIRVDLIDNHEGSVDDVSVDDDAAGSYPLSKSSSGTRIEVIDEEEHCKAREELKILLASQTHPQWSPPSPVGPAASHDTAVEDLKLLQRALVRYDQDLDEQERWGAMLYEEVSYALSPEERADLKGVSAVRNQIKEELASLKTSLMEKFHATVTMDRDQVANEGALWSPNLTQVMCEMIRLLKEQSSLRTFLDELAELERAPSPISSPPRSATSSPEKSRRKSRRSGDRDIREDDDGVGEEEVEVDLLEEVARVNDLTFPQVMTHAELMEELLAAKTDVRKMRVQAKHEVAMAVRDAKDKEIEKLRSIVQQVKRVSSPVQDVEASFREWSREKDNTSL